MKKSTSILFFLFFTNYLFSQVYCDSTTNDMLPWTFDTIQTSDIFLDTSSDTNSIWQVGRPQKAIINQAYSSVNAIITDTVNSYSVNDSSFFLFKKIDSNLGFASGTGASLSGYYFVNTDSLNDYGTIEISLDTGTSWIDLVNDTIYTAYYYWLTSKPVLTGNSNGWNFFYVILGQLGPLYNINQFDTILFRFSFISDSIPDSLDGLAFDDIVLCDASEGIAEYDQKGYKQFPNPATYAISIQFNHACEGNFILCDYTGRIVQRKDIAKGTRNIELNTAYLLPGMYYWRIDGKSELKGKFLVIR
jgi:Secretion system C-terminal sorting domain